MTHSFPALHIKLPRWIPSYCDSWDQKLFATEKGRMRFVIGLARENITIGTGGPFGAALFDLHTHKMIAPGVNLVLSSFCSVLHAEIVAIMVAQKMRRSYSLAGDGSKQVELVTSVAPCAMCLGAIPWAGIAHLSCGARDEDARAVGFDEGAKVIDWTGELRRRGIQTTLDICRAEAVDVLNSYVQKGGKLY